MLKEKSCGIYVFEIPTLPPEERMNELLEERKRLKVNKATVKTLNLSPLVKDITLKDLEVKLAVNKVEMQQLLNEM